MLLSVLVSLLTSKGMMSAIGATVLGIGHGIVPRIVMVVVVAAAGVAAGVAAAVEDTVAVDSLLLLEDAGNCLLSVSCFSGDLC